MKRTKSILCIILAFALIAGFAAGCGNSAAEPQAASDAAAASNASVSDASAAEDAAVPEDGSAAETAAEPADDAPQEEASQEESASAEQIDEDEALLNKSSGIDKLEGGEDFYPIETNADLTIMMPFAGMCPDILTTNQDNICLIEHEARTGIHVTVKDVSMTAYSDQVSLVVASGDYPDMICNLLQNYTSGTDAAIDDEVIIDLNDYRDYAPNYFYIIDTNPTVAKDTATDGGAIGGFYKLQAAMAAPKSGIHIRSDWLEEQGLDDPHTIDEFTEVFEVFKQNYDCTPVWIEDSTASLFAYAYDVIGGYENVFYQVDGQVKYGPIEDDYKDYLTQLHEWYEAGYINPDFISLDSNTMGTSDLTKALGNGEVGAWGGFADTPAQITSTIEGFTVADHYKAIPNPVRNEGDYLHLGTVMDTVDSASSSITTACSDIEAAMRWFDYWYTEEGSILYTYGIEDETFYWNEDHQAIFTDLIVNNPNYPAFFLQMTYMLDQGFGLLYAYREGCIYGYDSDIVKTPLVWLGDNYDGAYILSSKLSMTLEESEAYSSKYLDIETYVSEHVAAYVTGAESLDDYDDFVSNIYSMGIEDVLAIKQAALDRYNER